MQDLETIAVGLTSGSSFSSSSRSSIVVGPIPRDLWNARFRKAWSNLSFDAGQSIAPLYKGSSEGKKRPV
jgi:hypothetical protein